MFFRTKDFNSKRAQSNKTVGEINDPNVKNLIGEIDAILNKIGHEKSEAQLAQTGKFGDFGALDRQNPFDAEQHYYTSNNPNQSYLLKSSMRPKSRDTAKKHVTIVAEQ
jgi:hypothetical protein